MICSVCGIFRAAVSFATNGTAGVENCQRGGFSRFDVRRRPTFFMQQPSRGSGFGKRRPYASRSSAARTGRSLPPDGRPTVLPSDAHDQGS
jgi:hypothetical protein